MPMDLLAACRLDKPQIPVEHAHAISDENRFSLVPSGGGGELYRFVTP